MSSLFSTDLEAIWVAISLASCISNRRGSDVRLGHLREITREREREKKKQKKKKKRNKKERERE